MTLDYLSHQRVHSAPAGGDVVEDVGALRILIERPFDRRDLAPNSSNPVEQSFLFVSRVCHEWVSSKKSLVFASADRGKTLDSIPQWVYLRFRRHYWAVPIRFSLLFAHFRISQHSVGVVPGLSSPSSIRNCLARPIAGALFCATKRKEESTDAHENFERGSRSGPSDWQGSRSPTPGGRGCRTPHPVMTAACPRRVA